VMPAIATNGTTVLVAWHERRAGYYDCRQICFGKPCSNPPTSCTASSRVTFALGPLNYAATYAFTIPPNTLSQDPFLTWPPVIAPNGDSYAGLVHLPEHADVYLSSPPRQVTVPGFVLGQTALAGNGADVLVIWTSPQPTGIVVHADASVSARFPIAPSGYQPKVVSINSTEFLVLYRVDVGPQLSEIGGRIVQLQPARRRGIH